MPTEQFVLSQAGLLRLMSNQMQKITSERVSPEMCKLRKREKTRHWMGAQRASGVATAVVPV